MNDDIAKMTFEKALAELEGIVERLDFGEGRPRRLDRHL